MWSKKNAIQTYVLVIFDGSGRVITFDHELPTLKLLPTEKTRQYKNVYVNVVQECKLEFFERALHIVVDVQKITSQHIYDVRLRSGAYSRCIILFSQQHFAHKNVGRASVYDLLDPNEKLHGENVRQKKESRIKNADYIKDIVKNQFKLFNRSVWKLVMGSNRDEPAAAIY